ncbi:kinase-like domain-containing protein [Podospora australis]|uniref:Kinase-like domain-containing protein n=1 Tax=Podospora australis TaxID=1536484 RepID=A0AAN6WN15_9PEZI|nr:kinase-like domain-containing protein [Podospora australis]
MSPIPSVIVEDGAGGPPRLLSHASDHGADNHGASDQGTESAERLTVSDRGELLYEEANPQGLSQAAVPVALSPMASDGQTLMERLLRIRCHSGASDGPLFFPRGLVERLIQEDVVVEALQEEKGYIGKLLKRDILDSDIEQIARTVCRPDRGFRKIFAILALLERERDIVLCIEDKLTDADLPLDAVPTDHTGLVVKMRRRSDPKTDLPCLKRWGPKAHENFDKEQWAMVAPFFAKSKSRYAKFYELSKKDVLPWTEINSTVHQGGYSSISRVTIHPNHHNFEKSELSDGTFAIKHFTANRSLDSNAGSTAGESDLSAQLPDSAPSPTPTAISVSPQELKREFEREIETLNRFSGDSHPHLISLLAAYRHGDDYCLLFHWASSDLKTLWKNHKPGSALHKPNLQWILTQCRGIARGLQRIHVYQTTASRTKNAQNENQQIFGRHGDIKPENILLFQPQGTLGHHGQLVITDFGLTKFHRDGTKTYFSARELPATLTYQPPECDMIGTKISRSFDIWSLGCVLLEFITWHLGGWKYVMEFVQKRKLHNPLVFGWKTDHFYEIVRQPKGEKGGPVFARVKLEIFEFVNKLHTHPQCCDVIHQLLDFIMDRMLLVESKDINARASCSEVQIELNRLCEILESPTYEVKASPRDSKTPEIPEAVELPLSPEGTRLMNNGRFYQLKEHTGRTIRLSPQQFQDGVGQRRTQTLPTQPSHTSSSRSGSADYHG